METLTKTAAIFFLLSLPTLEGVAQDQAQKLEKVYAEILDFKAKGLPYSLQINKFLRIQEEAGINHPLSKEVLKLKAQDQYPRTRKATCSPKMNMKNPLALDRPKNQDSVNWCFNYAASDLIASEFGIEPSAAYLGINSLTYIRNPGEGFIGRIINGIQKDGTCLESDFKSGDYKFSEKHKDFEIDNLNKELTAFYLNLEDKKLTKNEALAELCAQEKLTDSLKEIVPNLTFDKIIDLILNFNKNNDAYVLRPIMDYSCKNVRIPDLANKNLAYINRVDQKNWSNMDKALDNGKIIGIEYDAGILEDYNYAASVLNGHASSIIGRRFNEKTNSCEYLLRNSWGKSCAGYHEDYECEDGHIWMAESFFQYSPNIRRAVYFEGKK